MFGFAELQVLPYFTINIFCGEKVILVENVGTFLFKKLCSCNASGNNFVNKSLTIHQRNLQLLMTEIFKTKNNVNPIFMKDIFAIKNSYYSLRNPNNLQLPKIRTTKYGTENIQFRGCSVWSSLPNSLKDSDSLQGFKRRIKQWDGSCCNCRLRRVFIKGVGFLH